jgi:chromosome segregation ATPase
VIPVNVEKTIEFILGQEARIEARFGKALERMDRADKRMDRADKRTDRADKRMDRADKRADRADQRADRADQRLDRLERVVSLTNRVVTRLVRYGVSLRSDIRRHDKAILRIEAAVASLVVSQQRTDDRLDALIRIVDRTIRRNGNF